MSTLLKRIDAYEKLIRLDRPIGILLLLWPTLWGLWIARRGVPDLTVLWIFVFGTVLMRSAGCAINDWADRDFDAQVERTKNRPLATGEIAPWEALVVAAVLALLAFLLILPLNTLTKLLSIPALAIAITYPFTKRILSIPQAYLGIAFSFGIPMAFAATLGAQDWALHAVPDAVPPHAWWLLAGNIFWVLAYDTEYAMVDRDDDLRIGMKSAAITLGRFDVPVVMAFYALYLISWSVLGDALGLGGWYQLGIAVAAAQALWHYTLIRGRTREGCFAAFRFNHWLGASVFMGAALDLALR